MNSQPFKTHVCVSFIMAFQNVYTVTVILHSTEMRTIFEKEEGIE